MLQDDDNPTDEQAAKLLEAAQERYAPKLAPNPANFPQMIKEEARMNVSKGEFIQRPIKDKRGKVKHTKYFDTIPKRILKKDGVN